MNDKKLTTAQAHNAAQTGQIDLPKEMTRIKLAPEFGNAIPLLVPGNGSADGIHEGIMRGKPDSAAEPIGRETVETYLEEQARRLEVLRAPIEEIWRYSASRDLLERGDVAGESRIATLFRLGFVSFTLLDLWYASDWATVEAIAHRYGTLVHWSRVESVYPTAEREGDPVPEQKSHA